MVKRSNGQTVNSAVCFIKSTFLLWLLLRSHLFQLITHTTHRISLSSWPSSSRIQSPRARGADGAVIVTSATGCEESFEASICRKQWHSIIGCMLHTMHLFSCFVAIVQPLWADSLSPSLLDMLFALSSRNPKLKSPSFSLDLAYMPWVRGTEGVRVTVTLPLLSMRTSTPDSCWYTGNLRSKVYWNLTLQSLATGKWIQNTVPLFFSPSPFSTLTHIFAYYSLSLTAQQTRGMGDS